MAASIESTEIAEQTLENLTADEWRLLVANFQNKRYESTGGVHAQTATALENFLLVFALIGYQVKNPKLVYRQMFFERSITLQTRMLCELLCYQFSIFAELLDELDAS